jgi:ubiquinone/menaquinone biosynthesis C-methylase UbiE
MSEEMHERSVAEAARVLKPGGKFIMRPFSYRNQMAGEDLLAKYFPHREVHIPTAEDRAEIQRLVGKRQFRFDDKDGDFRSFVGTKS